MSVQFHATNKDLLASDKPADDSISKYQFIHHFVPHPFHKKRARLLSHQALAMYCFGMIFFLGILKFLPNVAPGILGYASDISLNDLFKLTNERREIAGLETLRLNPELSLAAQKKAEHMFTKDYWAHVAPDGTEPWDFILGEGYDYVYAGENLAKNFSNSTQVVDAWMKSPSHRDNLMSPNYDEIGFAVVNGVLDGYETTLVVQMFGRPRNQSNIATVKEENILLEESAAQAPESVPVETTEVAERSFTSEALQEVLPLVDVSLATKGISFSLGGFLIVLLALDIWYSKKKGILKFNGHTFSHLVMLIVVMLGIWFVLKPGVIL